MNLLYKITLDFVPQKCIFSALDRTSYIWEKNTNSVHIYKGLKKINIIGGMGFEKNNFYKLTDIAISPDGKLLILDSFQKKVKKFDSEGKLITVINLENTSDPILLDISIDETFYIFDNNRKEIVVSKIFSDFEPDSFGKFQLSNPSQICISENNRIQVYDEAENKTFIFNTMGQCIEELEGHFLYNYNQKFKLSTYFIEHCITGRKFAISKNQWESFCIKNNYFILVSDSEVWITEFIYEMD